MLYCVLLGIHQAADTTCSCGKVYSLLIHKNKCPKCGNVYTPETSPIESKKEVVKDIVFPVVAPVTAPTKQESTTPSEPLEKIVHIVQNWY